MPLEVAHARTIHKFQGLSAGPVDEGKIPNMYKCVICDPDNRRYEGSALGLLYTATSRATTLGNMKDGRNSAMYFTGKEFKEERIRRLVYCKDSDKKFVYAEKREKWVAFLKSNERRTNQKVRRIMKRKDQIEQFMGCRILGTQLVTRLKEYEQASYNTRF